MAHDYMSINDNGEADMFNSDELRESNSTLNKNKLINDGYAYVLLALLNLCGDKIDNEIRKNNSVTGDTLRNLKL